MHGDCGDRGQLGEEGRVTQVELAVVQVEVLRHGGLDSVLDGAICFKVSSSEKVWVRFVEIDKVVSVRESPTVKIENTGSTVASSLGKTFLG